MLDRKEEEKLCDHLIKSAKRRDHVTALKLRDKVLNILTNKYGPWGSLTKEYVSQGLDKVLKLCVCEKQFYFFWFKT